VRTWCTLALDALDRAREEIDAINVYPVADGDTGTNLYLTLQSAAEAVDAAFTGSEPRQPALADVMRAMAHGALVGARGNSGTILAQLLRGMAQVLSGEDGARTGDDGGAGTRGPGAGNGSGGDDAAAGPVGGTAGHRLRSALARAAESAYAAVAHPVEGTVLTVATAAATAAHGAEGDCGAVARAAYDGACSALEDTPGQLAELGRAGVVDAGGQGLVVLLAALAQTLTGEPPTARKAREPSSSAAPRAGNLGAPQNPATPLTAPGAAMDPGGPGYEVIYLLEAEEAAVEALRTRLDSLGDSLVVGGGEGLWSIHVHVDDAGAAVEAGVEAGRPYRIRISHLTAEGGTHAPEPHGAERAQRAVVAVVPGEGLGTLCTEAGATAVLARPGEPPAADDLVAAIRRAGAHEVVLLPNDDELRGTAAAAADRVRTEGIRVAVIPTRAAVQGIAALAVHEPERRFDEDVVAMTSAAGATRFAELTVAPRQSWTTVGICQSGDILGLIDGDVAVIGSDPAVTATVVLDRMLAAGGEMVTLITSDTAPGALAGHLENHVRQSHLAVDTITYSGGDQTALLLVGVE
jgi:DAK2 domain fusion protein YloV